MELFNVEEIAQGTIVRPNRPLGLFMTMREAGRKLNQSNLPPEFFEEKETLNQQKEQLKTRLDSLHHDRDEAIQKAAISAITRLDREIEIANAERAAVEQALEYKHSVWTSENTEHRNLQRHKTVLEERLYQSRWMFGPAGDEAEEAELATDQALLRFLYLEREYERGARNLRPTREVKVREAMKAFENALRAEVELKSRRAA